MSLSPGSQGVFKDPPPSGLPIEADGNLVGRHLGQTLGRGHGSLDQDGQEGSRLLDRLRERDGDSPIRSLGQDRPFDREGDPGTEPGDDRAHESQVGSEVDGEHGHAETSGFDFDDAKVTTADLRPGMSVGITTADLKSESGFDKDQAGPDGPENDTQFV